MQKLSSLLFTASLISIIARAHESMAQTTTAPSKAGIRLITLGTAGGPTTRPDRAQSSNLLIVNGALYVVDAGDRVASRYQPPRNRNDFLSLTIMTITRRVLVRCCR